MDPNWKRICRSCCHVVDFRQLKPIFATPEINIIMVTMFPLKIAENDALPKYICEECHAKVTDTYKFLQQCLNSEKLLRDHASRVEEKKSLAVISESVYEQDSSMLEVNVTKTISTSAKRGIVSRVREFFESRSAKRRLSKDNVSRVLDFDQKMSWEDSPVKQDATINSTVVTDLDSVEEIPPEVIPEPVIIKPTPVLRRISSRRQFKCLYQSCSLKFETKIDRRKHLETHLSAEASVVRSKSVWKCKHCDAKFTNPELLLVHEKQHMSQILHGCDKCHKKFKTKANLVSHQRIHAKTKEKHKCKICLKEFTHVSTLYVHQIIHKPDVAQALVSLRS